MHRDRSFLLRLRLLFTVFLADGALLGAVTAFGRSHAALPVSSGGGEETLPAAEKTAALTFDDGPHAICTPRLLDGLRERGVHVSFFLMGANIAGNESLVRRMREEGHLVGNHSFRHVRLTKEGADAVCASVEQTQELIRSATGQTPEYLRPPYGDWNEELECRLSLTPVLWSMDSLDWKLRDADAVVRRVAGSVKNGDIILLHDIFPESVDAALRLADLLTEQGFRLVTVDELLID